MRNKRPKIEEFQDHVLDLLCEGGGTRHYHLHKPNDCCLEVYLSFTSNPNRMVIYGDIDLSSRAISTLGFGFDWFVKRMPNAEYMAEKFFDTEWVPEIAAESLEWLLKEGEFEENSTEQINELKELIISLKNEDQYDFEQCDFKEFMSELDRLNIIFDDGYPGFGYNKKTKESIEWLSAIHEKFREFYWRDKV